MARKPRTVKPINWKFVDELIKINYDLRSICRAIQVDEKRLHKELTNKYRLTYKDYSVQLRNLEKDKLRGIIWKRAAKGVDKWLMHVAKYHLGDNDFELQMKVKQKYSDKDVYEKKSMLQQLTESAEEMLTRNGSVSQAPPKPPPQEES